MNKRLPILFLALLVILSVTGFQGVGGPKISHPAEGALYPNPPDLMVTFSRVGISSSWKAYLNGMDITGDFVKIDAKTVKASGQELSPILFEGKNLFVVEGIGGTSSRTFYYDTIGPQVRITKVLENAGSLTIEGELNDISGVTSLRVNEMLASLTGSHFRVTVSEDALFTFVATDKLGHQRITEFARPEIGLQNATALRLSLEGFTYAMEEIADLFRANLDMEGNLLARNPIVNEHNVIGDTEFSSLWIVARDLSVDWVDLSAGLTPPNRVTLNSLVPNITSSFRVSGHILGTTFNTTVTVTTGRLNLSPVVSFIVDGAGNVRTQLETLGVSLLDDLINFGSLPDEMQESVRSHIRETLLDVAATEYRRLLPQLFDDFLAGVHSKERIYVDGWPMDVDFRPVWISVTSEGITFTGDGNLLSMAQEGTLPVSLGSIYQSLPLPGFSFEEGFDFRLLFSGNLLNRALYASFQAGRLSFTLQTTVGTFLESSGLASELPRLASILPNTPMRIHIQATQQPEVTLANSAIQLDFSGFTLKLEVLRAQNDQWTTIFESLVDLRSWLDVRAENRRLSFSATGQPVFSFVLTENNPVDFAPHTAAKALSATLPLIVPQIIDVLENLPTPQFSLLSGFVSDMDVATQGVLHLGGEFSKP